MTTQLTEAPTVSTPYRVSVIQPIQPNVDPLLATILSWPRAHDSITEQQFCKWLRAKIEALTGIKPTIRALGCITVELPFPTDPPTASSTLFSCHVDTIDPTVPPKDWPAGTPFKKSLVYDAHFGEIALDKDSAGGSLGADDGVGVWIMLNMLKTGVPGTYVFHRGEERGGLGSNAMLKADKAFLGQHETAIAFDRGHDFEVITHQGGQECASDKFGLALCTAFNGAGMGYELSRGGTFTDTKVYRGIIAECVNVAVGYDSQHGPSETLDYSHAFALMQACIQVNWDSLPVDRDPSKPDPKYSYGRHMGSWHDDLPGMYDDADLQPAKDKRTEYDNLKGTSLEDLEVWAEGDPYDAAMTIGKLIIEIAELRACNKSIRALAGLD